MGFCEVQDVERFLQLSVPTAKLASMQVAIDAATAAIRNYCQQQISQVNNDVVTLDGPGGVRLFLPELPVGSVGSVIEDGETLTVTDDYQVGAHGVLHRVAAVWAAGVQNVSVTYTHGYAGIPEDIMAVCMRAASRAYQAGLKAEELGGVPGVASKSLGDYSVSFGSEQGGGAGGESVLGASASPLLLRSEKEILNRYRYHSI